MNTSLDQELVRSLGAIPLLLPIMEQLGVREIINRSCHSADSTTADLNLGLVTLLLILNRLLAPQPLVHVEDWLAETVLPELLGIDAAQGNDDRLARTLDVLVPHLDALWQDLIVATSGSSTPTSPTCATTSPRCASVGKGTFADLAGKLGKRPYATRAS